MKFLYIRSKTNINEVVPIILEVFSKSLNIIKYINDDNSITIYYDYTKDNIKNLSLTLFNDLYLSLTIYESISYSNIEELEYYTRLVIDIFDTNSFHTIYINNQEILKNAKFNDNIEKLIFSSYYKDLEMYKTIKVFLEENQNATNASKKLYVHRNTLNQRLDKFFEKTRFNVKNFTEAYLIYPIVK